jgi:hypothetical protein
MKYVEQLNMLEGAQATTALKEFMYRREYGEIRVFEIVTLLHWWKES